MSSDPEKDVKTSVLDAAERLLAEYGVNGVPLRRILAQPPDVDQIVHLESVSGRRARGTGEKRQHEFNDLSSSIDHNLRRKHDERQRR
jgi:hypothetical protein